MDDLSDNDDQFFETFEARLAAKRKQERREAFYFGLLLVGMVGLPLGAFSIAWPVLQAVRGAAEITVFTKLSMASIAAVALGLVSMCGVTFLNDPQNISLRDMLVLAVVVGIGIAGFLAFKMYLESQGYQFSSI